MARPERLGDVTLRRLGWVLVGCFVLGAAYSIVTTFSDDTRYTSDWGASGHLARTASVLLTALFPAVAQLIVRQQPRNRIGWLPHAVGLSWAVDKAANAYVVQALVLHPGRLPGGEVVEVVASSLWLPPIVLMGVFVLLLFPDGRPPSPRWRALTRLAGLGTVILGLASLLTPGPVDARIPLERNPIGLPWAGPGLDVAVAIGLIVLPLSILAAAFAAVQRFRAAEGVTRLQLKWLMAAGAAVAAAYAAALTANLSHPDAAPGWVRGLATLATLSFGLLPIAIGVAITRHGLYGIDALISRALTTAVLGAFITAVYVGIVVGIGTLVGQRHPSAALSVLATALVAVAFQPVRERVQHTVNRLVYGDRATPYEVLAHFATQMAGRYTTGELLPRLAQTLSACLGGGRVEIWLRTGPELTRGGVCPAEADVPRMPAPDGDPLAGLTADRVVPVRHREELLGAIAVTKHAHEPFTPVESAMLDHVSSQAGLMLRNLGLVEDLQASRRRLVTAQDDERRRLERDLHDGAQQSLVSVSIMLGLVAQADAEERAEAIATASEQLRTAIAELRELAHGIHPAILTERGLGAAIRSLAERCSVPVTISGEIGRRLPATVEATLYFVVAEGLTNVAKYAGASHAAVRLHDLGRTLQIDITDDGVGGADAAAGTGLLGLVDRLAVIDGELDVVSPPGAGTRLSCRVPVAGPASSAPSSGRAPGQTPESPEKVAQAVMSPVV